MKLIEDRSSKSALPRSRCLSVILAFFIVASILSSCEYTPRVLQYDPARAFNGQTIFNIWFSNTLQVSDMNGNILWKIIDYDIGLDFEVLDNGDMLIQMPAEICLFRPPDTTVWSIPAPKIHHCVIQMPNGHIMYIFGYYFLVDGWDRYFQADGIREVDPLTEETIWEWRTGDHLSTDDYCPWHIDTFGYSDYYDWTHSNTIVYREEESAVYLNIRNLDRLVKIDYPSGEVLWSMGRGGDFGEGLFQHSHDPQFIKNGNILIFDNGNHRWPIEYSQAVEIAYDPEQGSAEVVWAWPTEPFFFDSAMGDANRLPNGNTLITSSHHGCIFEVTKSGEIVWSFYLEPKPYSFQPMLYKAERILFPQGE